MPEETSTLMDVEVEHSQSPEPSRGVSRSITREQALDTVGSFIISTMATGEDSDLDELLLETLDPHIINVLPAEHKQVLLRWAEHNELEWVIECIHQATEDKSEDTWIEVTLWEELE
ncbi:uncharacterized protein TrAtP1_007090 [Trichoderma atroviride]|uniref:Uncharacterized protein n=1 Tax=Hypocrea atroviridis (strain ATCC 20476 / IMI 206040) TaxID=452589 RepID=G9PC56_HYPAI|nr:uncharacterized protein TRIATDRAFT_313485 [Trichoderma atroviride IMI 206040]EHK39438.1 hypothetical protein TRIATDRAFT_313485 [Trichoderma atroviride IMI 206040]UKZ65902.1 hypothetical protein TrAtP1_007090 [Trichoderma atroviride]